MNYLLLNTYMDNAWSVDCQAIMDNLKKSMHLQQSKSYSFVMPNEEYLFLNLHCENELKETRNYLKQIDVQCKYNMLYNTKIPYTITYSPETSTIRMFQDQWLVYIDDNKNTSN